MDFPAKSVWIATAGSGDPQAAIDESYATAWAGTAWLRIDLGRVATVGGIEVYWGRRYAERYALLSSLDGEHWTALCATAHGEGGQNVFAFPPREARFLRLVPEAAAQTLDIVEINLYPPQQAMTVWEPGRLVALGQAPLSLAPGDSITVDFGYTRFPLGVLVRWGEAYGTVFSVHLSDDGENFREVGRIEQSHGDYDNFYWRTTTSRYLRFTLHEASVPEGAIVHELKLRILNKDRMPIGQLERAAQAGRGDLYPPSLLNRQVYWTALGEFDQAEQALFDEYGNLEPQLGGGQITPLLRVAGRLQGPPAALAQTLAEDSLPIPSVVWALEGAELRVTALAYGGAAWVEYRLVNVSATPWRGALVLALRPAQINPYWQHGGHAAIHAIAVDGQRLVVNDQAYAVVARLPDAVTVAEFQDGDVVRLIEAEPYPTAASLRSLSGLLSAALEFELEVAPGASTGIVLAAPMREGVVVAAAEMEFATMRERAVNAWRGKLGPRRIEVGDPEIGAAVETQIGLILVNATRHAFKPGPRNYDRTWIRDGSSQALALLYAGLIDEAKRYVLWYAERIYPNGMVPPILNPDGSVNRGYGSDIEFDAQGQFVAIATEVYRFSRDRGFLASIFEPVQRAIRFIEELCARTQAIHGPESRFYGLVAPSISHEGYNKPTYSYWDDLFALGAFREGAYLAAEIGASDIAADIDAKGRDFAAHLARSMRMTATAMGRGLVPASADREDVDPTSTAIAFEPCRVADVLPGDLLQATYDQYCAHLDIIAAPDFQGGFTPYEIRNLNALIALERREDAFRLLNDALTWRRPAGWRHWAEVVWGNPRVADYIGDMPHTWIGAEFATAIRRMLVREDGHTLELFRAVPEAWWAAAGIRLRALPTVFGWLDLEARREAGRVTVAMTLTGPVPERMLLRYPGARRASAEGQPCEVVGDVIHAPYAHRLIIEC